MPWFRIIFLVAVMAVTSGYRFRCYWFCTDQTGIQDDYVEQRDHCREYAQLKLDMAMSEEPGPVTDGMRKAKLVSLFADCMNTNGWGVPSGKDDIVDGSTSKPSSAPVAPTTPFSESTTSNAQHLTPPAAAAPVTATAPTADNHAYLTRQSECAFARQAASVSSISANRAKACDLECAQRLRDAPDAPRPAACPPQSEPVLSIGNEHY